MFDLCDWMSKMTNINVLLHYYYYYLNYYYYFIFLEKLTKSNVYCDPVMFAYHFRQNLDYSFYRSSY